MFLMADTIERFWKVYIRNSNTIFTIQSECPKEICGGGSASKKPMLLVTD